MSKAYNKLIEEINDNFSQIVGIINEIIEHRTDSFSAVIEMGEKVQNESADFLRNTQTIVTSISKGINSRIDNMNMESMRNELNQATHTFLTITEELELLSYNTICRTMALGDKGSTITHISKEIKKYSTTVKYLLDEITKEFSDIYDMFKYISDNILKNDLSKSCALTTNTIEQLVINSDVSALIENSQFHDIFTQELKIIQDALDQQDISSAYNAGYTFGIYEKAVSKLDFIKISLKEKLDNIQSVMKDFIYSFNTDLQNIVSQTNILREELLSVDNISSSVCETLRSMSQNTDSANTLINKAQAGVSSLSKHSKTFKNLVVVTAIEVARINDDDLKSVVVSMLKTEDELHCLIDTLQNNLDMWKKLQKEFSSTFDDAGEKMKSICDHSVVSERHEMLKITGDLDKKIADFHNVFSGEKYVAFFESNTEKLVQLFEEFTDYLNERFEKFSSSIPSDMMSDDLFTQGRNESELKDILAADDDQSSIEFF